VAREKFIERTSRFCPARLADTVPVQPRVQTMEKEPRNVERASLGEQHENEGNNNDETADDRG
jgi:hypothetical protein